MKIAVKSWKQNTLTKIFTRTFQKAKAKRNLIKGVSGIKLARFLGTDN